MTNQLNLSRLITASVIVIALQSHAAMGQATFADAIRVPPVPPEIQAPAGNTAFLKGHAVGTQNFICQPSESGFAWRFLAPQATLFLTFQWLNGGEVQQQIATHFLSPNPVESGVARPTWQSSLDTSAVWGRAIASSTDSNYVEAGAIAWLLLEVVGARPGPAGGSMLAQTTFIHRLNTSGGVVPAAGCSQSGNVGALAFVPYTADYFFYRAGRTS